MSALQAQGCRGGLPFWLIALIGTMSRAEGGRES